MHKKAAIEELQENEKSGNSFLDLLDVLDFREDLRYK